MASKQKTHMGRGGHNLKGVDEHKTGGTFRPHRHAERVENFVETVDELPIPKSLDKALHPKFLEVAKLVAALGILTPQDSDALQSYVQATHLKELAFKELQSGLFTGEGVNPAFRAYIQADSVLKPLRYVLGLNPKARQSLKTKKAIKKEIDPFAALLNK